MHLKGLPILNTLLAYYFTNLGNFLLKFDYSLGVRDKNLRERRGKLYNIII